MAKHPTLAYPDNSRSEWAIDWLKLPQYRADGMLAFEYAVYANENSRVAKDDPFLLNSHLAMVRETHQRIKLTPTGEYTHVSGLTVKPEDVEEFLATDSRANPTGLDPFMFPTYWGKPEALDPQWLRETYILPQKGQVDALIGRYLKGAEARRLSGDHRGTTLDLQVGATADDGQAYGTTQNNPNFFTTVACGAGKASSTLWRYGWFLWAGVTVSGTIDVATIDLYGSWNNGVNPLLKVYGVDEDNPSPPTTTSEYIADPLTAESVDWDGLLTVGAWNTSPSLTAIFQGLADSYTIDNENVMVQWKDDGSADSNSNDVEDYGSDTTLAAKLHIEYTAGGGPQSVTPSVVAFASSAQAPAVSGSGTASLTPVVISPSLVIQAPSVTGTGAASLSPVVLNPTLVVQSPTISGSGSVSLTPDSLSFAATFPEAIIAASGATVITPSVLAAALALADATISATGSATLTPDTLAAVLSMPPISIFAVGGTQTLTPDTLILVLAMRSPLILSGAVTLTLAVRSLLMTLLARDLALTIESRSVDLTLEDRRVE